MAGWQKGRSAGGRLGELQLWQQRSMNSHMHTQGHSILPARLGNAWGPPMAPPLTCPPRPPSLPLPLRRDVWIHVLFFTSSLVCLIFGLVHFFRGPLDTPLAISLIFMVYNIIPQFLLLQVRPAGWGGKGLQVASWWGGWEGTLRAEPPIHGKSMPACLHPQRPCSHLQLPHLPLPLSPQYVVYRKPLVFNAVCKLAMLLSTAVLILGVVLVWLLYPRSYDYKQVGGGGTQAVKRSRML